MNKHIVLSLPILWVQLPLHLEVDKTTPSVSRLAFKETLNPASYLTA